MLRELIEIITIGLPFCAFKIITGLYTHQYWLIALGLIDLLLNTINLLGIVLLRRRLFDSCLLSLIVRLVKKPELDHEHKWQDLGNAADMLLSFILVAFTIGAGHIKDIPPDQLRIWNLSVVFNVLGAGYSRLTHSIQNLKS